MIIKKVLVFPTARQLTNAKAVSPIRYCKMDSNMRFRQLMLVFKVSITFRCILFKLVIYLNKKGDRRVHHVAYLAQFTLAQFCPYADLWQSHTLLLAAVLHQSSNLVTTSLVISMLYLVTDEHFLTRARIFSAGFRRLLILQLYVL